MAYSKNPHLPRVRMEAVRLVRKGWSYRTVARHTGYTIGTISKWVARAPADGRKTIPTKSSRPKNHPNELSEAVVAAIIAERKKRGRCAEVVHHELQKHGVAVSLSSVKRTLKRHGLLKERSHLKRRHDPTPRPEAVRPGDLVQIDTIHVVRVDRFYVYTLLDVYSRWAHAKVSERITTYDTLRFMRDVKRRIPFDISMLQSDHGSEFSTYFSEHVNVEHRHSRVRTPNDNAHLERFNRTLQEECLDQVSATPRQYQKALRQYLPYYNEERPHLSLNCQTPLERFQAID